MKFCLIFGSVYLILCDTLMNPVSWLGNFFFTLIFLLLKMRVKCLLMSLKQPEKAIDILVALRKI